MTISVLRTVPLGRFTPEREDYLDDQWGKETVVRLARLVTERRYHENHQKYSVCVVRVQITHVKTQML